MQNGNTGFILNDYPSISYRGQVYRNPAHVGTEYDVVLISGDAYVDHPSFSAAVVCRSLERLGLSVAVIAQPDWLKDDDFLQWGRPDKFFAVVPGAMDSMVANYTATKMPRGKDRLSPGGKPGLRPKRAAQVYCQKLKQLFKGVPIILGGIEASLRRFVHYDFWEDKLRDPILMDAPADILVYGMAEAVLEKVVEYLGAEKRSDFPRIPQTCIRVRHDSWRNCLNKEFLLLPDVSACKQSPEAFMRMSIVLDKAVRADGKILIQQHPKGDILCFPPAARDFARETGIMNELKFNRRAHPVYSEPVPALEPVQFSIQSHRGCLGACTFCALALHQGRYIRSRKQEDIVREVKSLVYHPDFKGVIPDIGGPAVNMYGWECKVSGCADGICTEKGLCKNIQGGIEPIAELLKSVAKIDGVRHVFLGSGLRYDLITENDWKSFGEIILHHVSGQLKVAPEHFDLEVLRLMRKGVNSDFSVFARRFYEFCRRNGRKLFLVPYLMTAFPGCEDSDSVLEKKIRDLKLAHEQIQEFTPTPGSLASAMYYSGLDFNMKKINVHRKRSERLKTRKILHKDKKNSGRRNLKK
ncbi:MAG: YgiQ family radical SAM protein [Candidatus Rifleibacteriota bacterium]